MNNRQWSVVSGQWKKLSIVYCLLCAVYSYSSAQTFTIVPTAINVTCPGGNDGTASVSVSGGTSPYTYQWFPDGQTTQTVTGLIAGNYSVTITDNTGIDSTIMIPVSQPQPLTTSTTSTNVLCNGGNNGAATATVTNGTAPYTYSWNTSPVQNTQTANGLSAGTYQCTVTDANGCTSQISVTITQPQPIADNADIQPPICTSNGRIVLSPTGGTSPYQFSWNTGSTNQSITSIGAGDYSVIVTDANNCTANFSYQLTETECFVTPASYFTPNGDGFNDTWQIANAQYFDNARVIVFDRWGTRVYEHKGTYEPWDGKSYLGLPVPDAVYYYFFYEEKDDKQKNAKSGSVTILR